MFYYLIEKHMQRFRHFWRKKKFKWKSRLHQAIQLKAFVQKGRISLFGSIFISCRIKLILGRPACFDMGKCLSVIVFVELRFVFAKKRMQKNSVFQKEFLGANIVKVDVDASWTLTATSSSFDSRFFLNSCFLKEVEKQTRKKIDRSHIETVSRQNRLESGPFSTLFACANEATVGD